MNIESGPQLDLAGAARRRWKIAAWTAGLTFLAVLWISLALPNEYESYATLLVEPQAVAETLVQAGGEEVGHQQPSSSHDCADSRPLQTLSHHR